MTKIPPARRTVKLPTAYKTKGRLCPVCNKRTLFTHGTVMQCKTCNYKHDEA